MGLCGFIFEQRADHGDRPQRTVGGAATLPGVLRQCERAPQQHKNAPAPSNTVRRCISAMIEDASGAYAPARLKIDGYGNSCRRQPHGVPTSNGLTMIVLGIILLLIGYFTGISILYTIGGILLVIGVILWILGAVGRPVGGRKVWF